MWSLFAFGATGAPADNDGMSARAQARVRPDDSNAPTAPGAPEFNSRFSDTSGQRQGLSRRDVQAYRIESTRPTEPMWLDEPGDAGLRANDARQGTVGIYAAREVAGLGGHGTLPVSLALEPTIRDGAQLGGSELRANPRDIRDSGPIRPIPTNAGATTAEQARATAGSFGARRSGVGGMW